MQLSISSKIKKVPVIPENASNILRCPDRSAGSGKKNGFPLSRE
jgi:hypothetical protein